MFIKSQNLGGLILFLTFFLITSEVLTQDYFNKRLEYSFPWVFDGSVNALEIDDGYIINGVTGDPGIDFWHRIAVAKLNYSGDVIWTKNWGDTISRWYYCDRGSMLKRGDFYYSMGSKNTIYNLGSHSEMLMIKYDSVFDTLWTRYYGKKEFPYDTSYIPRSFKSIMHGFIVVGTTSPNYGEDSEIFLLKTDTLGNLLWEKTYKSVEYFYQGHSVIQTTDNGYAIGGYKFVIGTHGAAIGDPFIIKTDSIGNQEWELNLGGQYQDGPAIICNSADSSIISTARYDTDSIHEFLYKSRIQVTKITNNGNLLWNKYFGKPNKYSGIANCREDTRGGYIISGSHGEYSAPAPERMGFMLSVDSVGDSLWYRQYAVLYGQNSLNTLYDAIPVYDGGYLACGGCLPVDPDTGTQDAWVIKVDSIGCESPTYCWVGQDEIERQETSDSLLIYPNPAITRFKIKNNQFECGTCLIEFFDSYGRKIKEIKVPKGQSEVNVKTYNWKSGIYVVRVLNDRGLIGSKKVIIK